MICPHCATDNRPGRKFCSNCGTPLAVICRACGTANDPGDRFCGECGSSLEEPANLDQAPGPMVGSPAADPDSAPRSERRLVSVLFADLVGFTPLSEGLDAEAVRDLLTRYFDTVRRIVARYGGTVEKFIGDAVMAVWGAPVAQEDDAERAVRAALDMTSAVAALGQEVGTTELRVRAGVVTGDAAVTLGNRSEGMVAGDLVNTASRVQSVAPPGGVLVGDATRRATDAAIAYETAGPHQLKGKTEAIELWRATRVTAARGGSLRSLELEAPFVGREREMHLVKELFHASAEEGRAHLLSVVGAAGLGKSRLSWEFEKYLDGVVQGVLWHRGHCLAYGEGVTYWALAEMVRMRANILEEEEPSSAFDKLWSVVSEFVHDPEERKWIEPRLAHLLGLVEKKAHAREDLFAAWRLFFERLADVSPVVLVFEDIQWADASLLDFIQYLLQWSHAHPIFVVTLARPELLEKRREWGAGSRNFTSLYLDPIGDEAMEDLLQGVVPGLPKDVTERIRDRAEGVPLYAVETVRMLLDKKFLAKAGDTYRLARPIDTLDVPETLHALIAARLDGLSPDERRILQHASVVGKTFGLPTLTALAGDHVKDIRELLDSLVQKELLTVQVDPRSPGRGHYGFVQALVRTIAYDTLSKKDRRALNLAAAGFLERNWVADDDEIVEVIASHYLAAYESSTDLREAEEIKAAARDALAKAGERAGSLGARDAAQRYFERAAELSNDDTVRAEMIFRASQMAGEGGRGETAESLAREALRLLEGQGLIQATAPVLVHLSQLLWDQGRIEDGIAVMERSYEIMKDGEPDEDLAMLTAQLGRFYFFAEDVDRAMEFVERALEIAESLGLSEVISQALNSKALVLETRGRLEEGLGLMKHALDIAVENDLSAAALRALYNIGGRMVAHDRYDEALEYNRRGRALARRLGTAVSEWFFIGDGSAKYFRGMWLEVLTDAEALPSLDAGGADRTARARLLVFPLTQIYIHQGRAGAAELAHEPFVGLEASADAQERAGAWLAQASLQRGRGKYSDAVHAAEQVLAVNTLDDSHEYKKEAFVEGTEAAFELGDLDKVREFLSLTEVRSPARLGPYVRGHLLRFRARLAVAEGQKARAEELLAEAAGSFDEVGVVVWRAVALLEKAELLVDDGRDVADLLEECRAVFEAVSARPWLDRLNAVAALASHAQAG